MFTFPRSARLRPIAAFILTFPVFTVQVDAQEASAGSVVTLDTIHVEGRSQEGGAASGYKAETVQATGPWGTRAIQDTPYSISVVPSALIENTLATSVEDVFRANPFTQLNWPATRNGQTYVFVRGLSVSNKTVDGLRMNSYEVDAIENKERVEILNGLSGFLYGQADPGGSVNYVLKRPTSKAFADLTVANPGGSSGYFHADFGGPIDSGKRFAYRINAVAQAGETEVDMQHRKRQLLSAAFDWRLSERAILQLDYEHSYAKTDGVPPTWAFPAGIDHPSAPDTKKLWSQPWTFTRAEHNKTGARLNWDINDSLSFRAAASYSNLHDHFLTYNIASVAGNGHYTPFVSAYYPIKYKALSTYAFFDGKFSTGSVKHLLTFGYYGNQIDGYSQPNISQVCMDPLGTFGYANCTPPASSPFSVDGPLYVPMPNTFWDRTGGPWYKSSNQTNNNYVLGDEIKLTDQWSILAGVNYANIKAKNYDATGKLSGAYDKSRASPTVSVVYKPVQQVTTYLTYMEGLEQGQIVGTGYTNTGSVLSPLVSKQYEAGVKATVGASLLTLAVYRIEKPNQYSNNVLPVPTFVQDGQQVSQGVELGVTGKITDRLTAVGGVTFMNNEVKRSNDPLVVGKRPQAAADKMAKLYLEYDVPGSNGLVLNGAVNYTGDFAANARNTEILPSVVTLDLGARYTMSVRGQQFTSRLYVTNVTGKNYWMSPSFTGAPRTITYSLSASF